MAAQKDSILKLDKNKKSTYIAAAAALFFIVAAVYGLFIFQKGAKDIKPKDQASEVKSLEDIELAKRPYITLTPTLPGAEIVISMENISYFSSIECELQYLADNPQEIGNKIARGATCSGINTKDEKYKVAILLGTASKGVSSPDRGIIDGQLFLHMFKDEKQYDKEIPWEIILTGTAVKELKDKQDKFHMELPKFEKPYWIILTDTIGVPPKDWEFDIKNVITPIYGVFSVAPEFATPTTVSIKIDKDVNSPMLYVYSPQTEKWQKLDATWDAATKTISANVNHFGTFVVVSSN